MDQTNLRCIICPRKPKFCDLSHLLTHVASKAHLASYFELGVRSAANPRAADLQKAYDEWFEVNDLGVLLSERLTSKERRKKRKSENSPIPFDPQPTKKRKSAPEPIGLNTPTAPSIADYLDPRLAYSFDGMREEDMIPPTTPVTWTAVNNQKTRAGPTLRSMRFSAGTEPDESKLEAESQLVTSNPSMYPVTPTQPRKKKHAEDLSWSVDQESPDAVAESTHRTRASGKAAKGKKTGTRADEIARLKGVFWPGMDCFDAATSPMRRRRNQKKDDTVLKQMEVTSLLVQPSEQIFSPSGSLLANRVITGNVEDYSPLKGETPVPRRRQIRPRNALIDRDPNVPRALDRKRQKLAPLNVHRESTPDTPFNGNRSPLHRGMVDSFPTIGGYDEELDMTVNAFGKRARGGFDVFADEDGNKQPYTGRGMDEEPKGRVDTLTPTRLLLNKKPAASGVRKSKVAKTAADKENIEPILNPHGRIGFGLGRQGWHSPLAKRATDPGNFGPQYLDESSFSGLGGSYNNNSDKTGYQSNPLFAPKSCAYDSPFKQEDEATHNDWSSTAQAPASEATIPEEEQLEYPGVYLITSAN
ncbi:hypothetical protein MYU51_000465 [Penicillium brevicompactum]